MAEADQEPSTTPNPGSPHDLIRACITLAAITIALASFQKDPLTARAFLFCGLGATLGAGYAMAQLWADSNMRSLKHLLFIDAPEGMGFRFGALVFLTWSMIGLVLIYASMLIRTVR
jgi:hypothetical protein